MAGHWAWGGKYPWRGPKTQARGMSARHHTGQQWLLKRISHLLATEVMVCQRGVSTSDRVPPSLLGLICFRVLLWTLSPARGGHRGFLDAPGRRWRETIVTVEETRLTLS